VWKLKEVGTGLVQADVWVRGRLRSCIFRNGTAGHDDFCGCRSEERLIGAYMPRVRVIMMVKDRLRWRQAPAAGAARISLCKGPSPLTQQKTTPLTVISSIMKTICLLFLY
jgi:hypothetical protein